MNTTLRQAIFMLLIVCAAPFIASALTAAPRTTDTSGFCPELTLTLSRGARDAATRGQVSELQVFLTDYFSLEEDELVGGFFGRLTQSYVQRFQQEQGLPAYGLVGSMTRVRIAEVCGKRVATPRQCPVYPDVQCASGDERIAGLRDSSGCLTQTVCRPKTAQRDFFVQPETGTAPLSVTFYAMVGGRAQYAVDFGDGTGQQFIACNALLDACVSPGKLEHTYAKAGNYQAILKRVYRVMELQPGDRVLGPLASVTVNVKEKEIVSATSDPRCRVWFDGCNTCVRDAVGGALACTKMACQSGYESRAQCREYFATGKNDYPPSITAFSGSTQLEVNQDGYWRIEASDKEGQQLTYAVDWGEYGQASQSMAPVKFSQYATFSHRYLTSGVYTVGITVYDSAGGSATSSATVNVGSSASVCTADYRPVCGERRICSNGQQTDCWNEKKTFGNLCSLRAENAFYLYDGECARGTQTYTPPSTCRQWFDGCNTCSRSTAEGVAGCTERACTSTTSGYCSAHFETYIGAMTGRSEGNTVTITGPAELVQKMQSNATTNCEYTLDWGDGTQAPSASGCAASLSHTYATPGTFTVQATLYRSGTTTILWKNYIKPKIPSTATY